MARAAPARNWWPARCTTSARGGGPFTVCNCAAIPENLVESELFGHTRGSFTGATHDQAGMFEHAHGGVLFLDEIGEMPLPAQAKLLRRRAEPGDPTGRFSETLRKVNVRIVAATNRDLAGGSEAHFAKTCSSGWPWWR